jgi:hypothetical protein
VVVDVYAVESDLVVEPDSPLHVGVAGVDEVLVKRASGIGNLRFGVPNRSNEDDRAFRQIAELL